MDGLNIVANRSYRKARPMIRLGSVTGRRGMPVAEKFRGDQKKLRSIEGMIWPNQPLIPVKIRHVVRRQEDHVVFGRVEMSIGPVDHAGLRQRHAALRFEVCDHKFVAFAGFGLGGSLLRQPSAGQKKQKQPENGHQFFHRKSSTVVQRPRAILAFEIFVFRWQSNLYASLCPNSYGKPRLFSIMKGFTQARRVSWRRRSMVSLCPRTVR